MVKVRPHFKTHLSMPGHPKMLELYQDKELLGIWLSIGVEAMTMYAAKNHDTVCIPYSKLESLTGRSQRKAQLRLLQRLTDLSPMSVKPKAKYVVIQIPNLAIKHGIEKSTVDHKKIYQPPSSSSKKEERREKRETPSLPDGLSLPEGFLERLAEHNQLGTSQITAHDVAAWIHWIWARYSTKHYKNNPRALSNWWSRVTREELNQAIAAHAKLTNEKVILKNIAGLDDEPDPFEGLTADLDFGTTDDS